MAPETPIGKKSQAEDALHHIWQHRLLPFLVGGVFLFGVAFFIISAWQLNNLRQRFEQGPDNLLSSALYLSPQDVGEGADAAALRAVATSAGQSIGPSFVLEHDLVARRYHQANSLMVARVWFGYMMITTGMILCLIGSLFVLGKLSAGEARFDGKAGQNSVSFVSTSPGLVLAFFGATLAISSQFFATRLSITDTPVYVLTGGQDAGPVNQPTKGFE